MTIGFLVTSLDKPLLHQLLKQSWLSQTSSRITEATALLGNFSASEMFCSLPQICASTQSYLWALQAVPLTSWLGFALICTASCEACYREPCAFPNHVRAIYFTTGGVQSRCRNISAMSYISSVVVTYVNVIFQFFLWTNVQTFLKLCFHFVIMRCRLMRKKWNIVSKL